ACTTGSAPREGRRWIGRSPPLARTLAERRPSSGLPAVDGAVAQHAVWGVLPAAVEQVLEVHRVRSTGLQHPVPIVRMDRRLRTGEKPGADPGRACAEG